MIFVIFQALDAVAGSQGIARHMAEAFKDETGEQDSQQAGGQPALVKPADVLLYVPQPHPRDKWGSQGVQ